MNNNFQSSVEVKGSYNNLGTYTNETSFESSLHLKNKDTTLVEIVGYNSSPLVSTTATIHYSYDLGKNYTSHEVLNYNVNGDLKHIVNTHASNIRLVMSSILGTDGTFGVIWK